MYHAHKHFRVFTHKQSKNAFKSQTDKEHFGQDIQQTHRKIRVCCALETYQETAWLLDLNNRYKPTNTPMQGRNERLLVMVRCAGFRRKIKVQRWGGGGGGKAGEWGRYSRMVKSITWDAKQKTGCSYISLFFPIEKEGGYRGMREARVRVDEHRGHQG